MNKIDLSKFPGYSGIGKTCTKCNKHKQFTQFVSKRAHHCDDCRIIKLPVSLSRIDGMSARLISHMYRAKYRGLEFNLTEEDLVIPELCPVFGIKLNSDEDGSKANLDRVDNNKGYIKGNVCWISERANRIKSDATVKELESLIIYMKSYGN